MRNYFTFELLDPENLTNIPRNISFCELLDPVFFAIDTPNIFGEQVHPKTVYIYLEHELD